MTGSPTRTERIALFQWNGLGDHLLALPAVRSLAHRLSGQVKLLEGPGRQFMFYEGVPLAERVDIVLRDLKEREIDVEASLAGAGRCDVFLSFASWVNPSLMALARGMGARRTIGLFHPFDEPVPLLADRHMFDNHFALALHLLPEVSFIDHARPPACSPAAMTAAHALRQRILGPGEKLLFVHPETREEKMWTPGGFSAALGLFLAARPLWRAVVVTARPYPIDVGAEVCGRVVSSEAHLELALALLSLSDLFLGIDSVFLHAADLQRLPGVALFGPATEASHWGFRLSPGGRNVTTASFADLSAETVAHELLAAAEAA